MSLVAWYCPYNKVKHYNFFQTFLNFIEVDLYFRINLLFFKLAMKIPEFNELACDDFDGH